MAQAQEKIADGVAKRKAVKPVKKGRFDKVAYHCIYMRAWRAARRLKIVC